MTVGLFEKTHELGGALCSDALPAPGFVGKARTTALREIWNNERMNEIRRLVLRKEYERINPCNECSVAR